MNGIGTRRLTSSTTIRRPSCAALPAHGPVHPPRVTVAIARKYASNPAAPNTFAQRPTTSRAPVSAHWASASTRSQPSPPARDKPAAKTRFQDPTPHLVRLRDALHAEDVTAATAAVPQVPWDQILLHTIDSKDRRAQFHRARLLGLLRALNRIPTTTDDPDDQWTTVVVDFSRGLAQVRNLKFLIATEPYVVIGELSKAIAKRRASAAVPPLLAVLDLLDVAKPVKVPGKLWAHVLRAVARAGTPNHIAAVDRAWMHLVELRDARPLHALMAAQAHAEAALRNGSGGHAAHIEAILGDARELQLELTPEHVADLNGMRVWATRAERGSLAAYEIALPLVEVNPTGLSSKAVSGLASHLATDGLHEESKTLLSAVGIAVDDDPRVFHAAMLADLAADNPVGLVDRVGTRLERAPAACRTVYAYETLYRAHRRLGNHALVLEIHDELRRTDPELVRSRPYYTTLIAITAEFIGLDRALALLKESFDAGVPLSTHAVSHILRHAVERNDEPTQAALRGLVHSADADDIMNHPDLVVAQRVHPALRQLDRDLNLDQATKVQILQSARQWLDRAVAAHGVDACQLDHWTMYIHAHAAVYPPLELVDHVRAAHAHIVHDLGYGARAARSVEYLTALIEVLSHAPRTVTHHLVQALWARHVDGVDTYVLGDHMLDAKWRIMPNVSAADLPRIVPDDALISVILDHFGHNGTLVELRDFDYELRRNLPPHGSWRMGTNAWTSLIEAYLRHGDAHSARRILVDDLKKYGVVPNDKMRRTVWLMTRNKMAWLVRQYDVVAVLGSVASWKFVNEPVRGGRMDRPLDGVAMGTWLDKEGQVAM
ncbi:pentatricopeptide repeat domain-containing protein [Allomyces macrogynus ATCC 38327]|uniref:Pentatricopeptide repeat domain-containing protein n=1 Tax=Allomyces macrogynus (strain ATCC 38327) TaxID=578462 RepID=A0A0L0SZY9_ALLM3|nr:pentatricopeptide repeat domain-containing protein [Allomyces macrogynus ATCC 38327]|eukprot:KNE68103.1 pentatricopeptide repeat domain-containing protein [Allomyces macrogynus ATCC 38327]